MASVMYGAQAGGPGAGRAHAPVRGDGDGRQRRRSPAGGDKKKDGGVIDAEFEETPGG